MKPTVLWFRRDLRLHDHPALHHALAGRGPVAPLFVVDERLLQGRWASPNRLWFMSGSVRELALSLAARGASLTVLRGDPADVVPDFAHRIGARTVVVSRDYTPYGRARDEKIKARLDEIGIGWEAGRGLLIQEPEAVLTDGGRPFVVFSPFHRTWQARHVRDVRPAPDRIDGRIEEADSAQALPDVEPTADRALLLAPGEPAARSRLLAWSQSEALDRYATDRDRLDLNGTSRLSQDLRWGLLSPVEVLALTSGPGEGRRRFVSELAWRDFYAHVLWHEPRVARTSFRSELDTLAWEARRDVVDAWRAGRTGFPVVDAAMRQLAAAGWMHNRARMIVASFLTKHLGVDWRVGEQHFMHHLVDGDPASNNGGWQWAASTGTDPHPWPRIFNPTLQGLRHDPDGAFVRRWIPELRGVSGNAVHEPRVGTYLRPIVDHATARARALAAYAHAAGASRT